MKTLLFLLLFSTLTFAKTNIIVSILPQKIFVDMIGGEKVHTSVMVQAGASPHNYEPKPSQMLEITKAKLYFSIGVEFEKVWLKKFQNQNKNLIISDISHDINKSIMQRHHHDEHKAHHEKDVTNKDPHIWVDPINVKQIAENIYETLVSIDANNSNYYKANLTAYLKELETLDNDIKTILKDTPKDSAFMVFHPAWGYFAKRYELKQLPVEVEGKSPKMKTLVKIMQEAKEEKVQAIFTQPEFSDKAAQLIAKNLNIQVIKASPLAHNWAENLKNLAKAIAQQPNSKKD
ncbi:zinc ABC transporter substrate-binding protein [bacterium]|nr:zinc ABC transporter substrate-binding protein [bacterium]MBU1958663.1 zinc ABC transporter substrate-binding protein [bacterium]